MIQSKMPIGTVGLMLGLPAVLSEFMWSYGNMIAYSADYVAGPNQYINLDRAPHSFHSVARSHLAKCCMGDWILMLDTDHSFEPDLLARLLNASKVYQAPVVSGMYLMKNHPHLPTIWKIDDDLKKSQIVDWSPNEVLEIGAAGAGCLLIHRWVLDKITEELGEEPFSTSEFPGTVGEDFAFFYRLKRIGIKPVVVPWIECNHLLVHPLSVEADCDRSAVRSVETKIQSAVPVA